ncbi:MAG: GIY-YIG nuclease family protein [Burkholderiales bacterium]|nr:GIY-YIG nuclease family protein [Burkholderiales bacterium]
MSNGVSINLFLVDGSIDGVIKAESPNWTGQCLKFPADKLLDVIQRDEIKDKVGIYFLFGDESLYIGESESLDVRLKQHLKDDKNDKNNWWNQTVIFSSSNNFLTKAHVKYLENKLIELARKTIKFKCTNLNNGVKTKLNEALQNDADNFIEYVQNFVAILGFNIFVGTSKIDISQVAGDSLNEFYINEKGVFAEGLIIGSGGILVKSNSQAVDKETPSISVAAKRARQQLLENGILKLVDGKYIFQEDFQFDSLSSASSVILGRSSNGRTCWRQRSSNKTFKELEIEQLDKIDKEK